MKQKLTYALGGVVLTLVCAMVLAGCDADDHGHSHEAAKTPMAAAGQAETGKVGAAGRG